MAVFARKNFSSERIYLFCKQTQFSAEIADVRSNENYFDPIELRNIIINIYYVYFSKLTKYGKMGFLTFHIFWHINNQLVFLICKENDILQRLL